jgi:hypothetical protein
METNSHKVACLNSISENINLKVKMLSTNPRGRRPFDVRNQFSKISVTGLMMNLGFVVPCIFKYSIKQPTRCTTNLIFIALSRRHRSTCFGHCCAHHQEPPPTAFAASGYRMIAGLDVLQAVVGLLFTVYCRLAVLLNNGLMMSTAK